MVFSLLAAKASAAVDLAESFLDASVAPEESHLAVALSPDGENLAWGHNVDGRLVIEVTHLADGTAVMLDVSDSERPEPTERTKFFLRTLGAYKRWWGIPRSGNVGAEELTINYVEWVTNQRIVCRLSDGGMFAVNADGENRTRLLQYEPFEEVLHRGGAVQSAMTVDNLLPDDPVHIAVSGFLDGRDRQGFTWINGVFGVNIDDGSTFLVKEREPDSTILLDQFGAVQGSVLNDRAKGGMQISFYDQDTTTRTFAEIFGEEEAEAHGISAQVERDVWARPKVLGFGYSDQQLFLTSRYQRDTSAVFAADRGEQHVMGPIFAPEHFDVESPDLPSMVFVPELAQIGGFRFQGLAERTVWRLPEFAKIQASLDKSLPNRVNRIYDWDRELKKFLVFSFAANEPGEVLLLDVEARKLQRKVLLNSRIDRSVIGEGVPVWIDTRDDRKVLCYLTMHPRVSEGPAPLVVLFANQEWKRYTFGYDEAVQYFAANGYAVLQVNHRGVGGFGRKHLNAARGRYADAAAEDVEDAIGWLANRDVIDPNRVFVAGDRLGAWLALHIAVRDPDMVRAVLCLNPVCDPDALRQPKRVPRPGVLRFLDWAAADLEKSTDFFSRRDRRKLDAMAPLLHADQLTMPIFLCSVEGGQTEGYEDLWRQAQKLHDVLIRKEVPCTLLLVDADEVTTREQLKAPALAMMSFLKEHDSGARQ